MVLKMNFPSVEKENEFLHRENKNLKETIRLLNLQINEPDKLLLENDFKIRKLEQELRQEKEKNLLLR